MSPDVQRYLTTSLADEMDHGEHGNVPLASEAVPMVSERLRVPLTLWNDLDRVASDHGLTVSELVSQLVQGGLPFYEAVTRRAS